MIEKLKSSRISIGLVLLTTVLVLYHLSSINTKDHQNVLSILNKLESSHASLNEEILRIRLNKNRSYDFITVLRKQKMNYMASLKQKVHLVLGEKANDSLKAFDTYEENYRDMLPDLDRYISANAIMRNSIDYFVYTLREKIEALRVDGVIVKDGYRTSDLDKLLIHIIELNQGIGQHSDDELKKEKDLLKHFIDSLSLSEDYKYNSLPHHLVVIHQQVGMVV